MADEVEALASRCLAVLASRPSGLLTDIDGTISLIAPTPEAATVGDEAKEALRKLALSLDIVGVITGRAAENAESMVTVPRLIYVGNHGLEHRVAGVTHVNPAAVIAAGAIAESMAAVETAAAELGVVEGILYENKGVTGSIHYRLAPDQDAASDALLPLARDAAEARGLKVTEGRMVIELRPMLAINKGTALLRVMQEADLNSLVFFGDDVTDIDAFRALSKLRADGTIAGLNVAVVAPESNPDVANAADDVVHGVECCVRLLTYLADELYRPGGNE